MQLFLRLLSVILLYTAVSVAPSASARVIPYAATPGAIPSSMYTLTVDGHPILVERFKDVSYARFAVDGTSEVEIRLASQSARCVLSPRHECIPVTMRPGILRFPLTGPRMLVAQCDGVAEKLFIFADPPEVHPPRLGQPGVTNLADYLTDSTGARLQTRELQAAIDSVASRGGGVLYVPDGKVLTGTFTMKSGVTLYLASGALVQGSDRLEDYNDNGSPSTGNRSGRPVSKRGALVYFDHADGAKIAGRGVLALAGTALKARSDQKIRICNMVGCRDVGIEDILLRDSAGFTVHVLHSSGVMLRGYKIVNDLSLPNEDGTDPDGCDGVTVDHVFMYTSDDAIAVKADLRLCQNVLVKNCVFWTKKSALKVGSDPIFGARNIVFENNDVIHADRALALYAAIGFIDGVTFRNNRSEFVGGDAKRQLLVFQVSRASKGTPPKAIDGFIRHVLVDGYDAYQASENPSVIGGYIDERGAIHGVSQVRLTNVSVGGRPCTDARSLGLRVDEKDGSQAGTVAELLFE